LGKNETDESFAILGKTRKVKGCSDWSFDNALGFISEGFAD